MVACLIPLYIYREKFFSAKYENNANFNVFLKDLKFYMQKHHPKIHIEYSIVDKTKNELNLTIRETLIIENIVNQFFTHEKPKRS